MFKIIVPKTLIIDSKNNNKLLVTYCFLSEKKDQNQIATFNLEELIEYSGQKINKNHGERNVDYISALKKLVEFEYVVDISRDVTLNSSALKSMRSFKLSDRMFYHKGVYADVMSEEIISMKKYCMENNRIKFITLLNFLLYIRANLNYANKGYKILQTRMNIIVDEMNTSNQTANKILDILVALNLIIYKKMKNVALPPLYGEFFKKTYQAGFYVFATKNKYISKNGKYVIDDKYNPEREVDEHIKEIVNHRVKLMKEEDEDLFS